MFFFEGEEVKEEYGENEYDDDEKIWMIKITLILNELNLLLRGVKLTELFANIFNFLNW